MCEGEKFQGTARVHHPRASNEGREKQRKVYVSLVRIWDCVLYTCVSQSVVHKPLEFFGVR